MHSFGPKNLNQQVNLQDSTIGVERGAELLKAVAFREQPAERQTESALGAIKGLALQRIQALKHNPNA